MGATTTSEAVVTAAEQAEHATSGETAAIAAMPPPPLSMTRLSSYADVTRPQDEPPESPLIAETPAVTSSISTSEQDEPATLTQGVDTQLQTQQTQEVPAAADNEPVGDLPGFSDDEEDAPVAASPPRKEQVKPSKPEMTEEEKELRRQKKRKEKEELRKRRQQFSSDEESDSGDAEEEGEEGGSAAAPKKPKKLKKMSEKERQAQLREEARLIRDRELKITPPTIKRKSLHELLGKLSGFVAPEEAPSTSPVVATTKSKVDEDELMDVSDLPSMWAPVVPEPIGVAAITTGPLGLDGFSQLDSLSQSQSQSRMLTATELAPSTFPSFPATPSASAFGDETTSWPVFNLSTATTTATTTATKPTPAPISIAASKPKLSKGSSFTKDEDYSPQIDLDDDEITQDEVIMRAQQRCDLRDMKREMTSDSNLSFVFNNDENSQTLLDLGLSMSIIGSGGSSNSNIGTSIGTSKGDLKRTPSLGQGRGSFLGSKASESQLKTLNMLSAEPKQAATAKRPVVLANYAKATVASNATTPSSIEVQAGSSKNSLKRPATVPSPATVTPTTKKAKTSSSSSTSAGIPKPSLLSKVLRTTSASIF